MSNSHEAEILRLRGLLKQPDSVSVEYLTNSNDELRARNAILKDRVRELEARNALLEAQNTAQSTKELEANMRIRELEERVRALEDMRTNSREAAAKVMGVFKSMTARFAEQAASNINNA